MTTAANHPELFTCCIPWSYPTAKPLDDIFCAIALFKSISPGIPKLIAFGPNVDKLLRKNRGIINRAMGINVIGKEIASITSHELAKMFRATFNLDTLVSNLSYSSSAFPHIEINVGDGQLVWLVCDD